MAIRKSDVRDIDGTGRSADRALAVIDLLVASGRPLTASRIATECAIPRSSVYPLLGILEGRGYVTYDARRRAWESGPRLQQLDASSSTIHEAVLVLDAFSHRDGTLAPSEIAARTGLDVERVSRTLYVLEDQGLVNHSGTGRFGLGLRLAGLAARIGPVDRLRTATRPALLELRDRTGETANLLIRDGAVVLYLDQVESQLALRHAGWIGRTVPLSGTAVGSALLGRHGAHVAINAVEIGVTAVACWIPGSNDPPAVVSVTGPSARLRGIALQRARDAVEEAARAAGRALETASGG